MWSLSIIGETSTWTKQTVVNSPSPRYSTVYGIMNELLVVSHGGCWEEGRERREREGDEGRGGEEKLKLCGSEVSCQ